MADKLYSVDDIINEYSGKGGGDDGKKESVDELLENFRKNDPTETVTLHNTDIFGKINEETPDNSGEKPEKTAKPEGAFEEKYSKLSEKMNEVAKRESETPEKVIKGQGRERSFSEKIESGFGDDKKAEKGDSLAQRFKNRKKQEENEEAPAPEPTVQKPVQPSPFDKYEAIAQDNAEDDEAEDKAPETIKKGKSLDEILDEYSRERPAQRARKEFTQHRSITEFFTRKIPTDDAGGELSDEMRRLRKERMSRTQGVTPVERKSISDIDLKLDDKILPDTAQFKIDAESAKLDELKERRSKKIKDFVLVGDEEDEPDEEPDEKAIEDYEEYDDAAAIVSDIDRIKGTLTLRLIVVAVCLAVSAYISLANDLNIFPMFDLLNKRTQTNTYLFVNAIIGILAAFSAYPVISCGLSKLFSMKADCDSLSAVAMVTGIANCVIMFANSNLIKGSIVHIYLTTAILSLLFNTIGKLLIVTRTKRSFSFVSGSGDKYALLKVEDEETAQNFTRGTLRDFPNLVSMKKTEMLRDFLKISYAPDSTDNFCRVFTPIILAAGVIVGVLAGFVAKGEYGSAGAYVGFSVFTGCVAICSAVSLMLVVNLPMEKASKKNSELQGALLGYDAVEEFADTNSVLIDAAQLFPQGSVTLSAIKVFSDTRIDEAIVEAASLTNQSGSILKNMFYDIIAGKTELLNPVESYIFEDSMGLCGWINNKRVLLGSRELMINHSIEEVPSAAKEQEYTRGGRSAVYLSISGELSAMFIVEISPSLEVKRALTELSKQGVYTVIKTVDSLISINLISELYGVSSEYFKLLPFRLYEKYEETVSYEPKVKATAACSGKFAALSSIICGCKNLRGTITTGIALEAVSVLLGIMICFAMVLLKCFGELSATMTCAYNLCFALVFAVFQTFRKT
ncbi:MAG: hypothetical protein MRZ39_04370 [Oscillospiraceae bacterium]|nr:hypothetical protein [Oscillospiraceae bacterium]